MRNIEEELRKALARQSPQPDFTARVLAAVEQRERERERNAEWKWLRWLWSRRMIPVLAGLLALSAAVTYRQHERAVRGKEAKQKLVLAMHIAGSELQQARAHVFELQSIEIK